MGRPKHTIALPDGSTLLEKTLAIAETFAAACWVVGADEQSPDPGVTYLKDDQPGEGPLAAAATVLARASSEWVLLLACDVPQLTADAIERVRAETSDAAVEVVMARGISDDRPNPLIAYHRTTLASRMREAVDRGERSIVRFLDGAATRVVTIEAPASLASVNTPAEWAAFLAHLRGEGRA